MDDVLPLLASLALWALIITGIVRWRRSRVRSPLDMACPECGNGTGSERAGLFDRTSKTPVSRALALAGGFGSIALVVAGIFVAMSVWAGGDGSCSGTVCIEWQYGAGVAGLGFLATGLGAAWWAAKPAIAYQGADRVSGVGYRCGACRTTWVRLDDEPPGVAKGPAAPTPAQAA